MDLEQNLSVLSQVLTSKYNFLEEWISGNKLFINPDKKKFIFYKKNLNSLDILFQYSDIVTSENDYKHDVLSHEQKIKTRFIFKFLSNSIYI